MRKTSCDISGTTQKDGIPKSVYLREIFFLVEETYRFIFFPHPFKIYSAWVFKKLNFQVIHMLSLFVDPATLVAIIDGESIVVIIHCFSSLLYRVFVVVVIIIFLSDAHKLRLWPPQCACVSSVWSLCIVWHHLNFTTCWDVKQIFAFLCVWDCLQSTVCLSVSQCMRIFFVFVLRYNENTYIKNSMTSMSSGPKWFLKTQ